MDSKLYYSDKKKIVIYRVNAKLDKETIKMIANHIGGVFPHDYRILVLPAGTEVIDMDIKED
jgi:uncharacterized protein (DUF952 family)